jgi:hypothetical protein
MHLQATVEDPVAANKGNEESKKHIEQVPQYYDPSVHSSRGGSLAIENIDAKLEELLRD